MKTKAQSGKLGGKAKTPARQAASRINGARPRKVAVIVGGIRRPIIRPGFHDELPTMGGGSPLQGYIIHKAE